MTDELNIENLSKQAHALIFLSIGRIGSLTCFNCGECSSTCPISSGRHVFDPSYIFRIVNMWIVNELLKSPSIWLSLDCGRCSDARCQLVDGRQIIDSKTGVWSADGKKQKGNKIEVI